MIRRLLFLTALFFATLDSAHAASSVATSWPTNVYALTDGTTISPRCPGSADTSGVGVSGLYTLTVTGNNHTISLPSCSIPSSFLFRITQGSGGPYTGLTFSGGSNTITFPGGTVYTQTAVGGAIDIVGGQIVNSTTWDFFAPQYNMLSGAQLVTQVASHGTTTFTTSAINTTVGGVNLIAVCVVGVSYQWPTLSDLAGNTWTLAGSLIADTNSNQVGIYYKISPATNAAETFTLTAGASFFATIGASAWNIAGTPAFDQSSQNTAASGTSIQPGSLTPAQANDIALNCVAMNNSTTGAPSTNSSFTNLSQNYSTSSAGGSVPGGSAYLINTGVSALNPTTTWAGTGTAAASMALFK